MTCATLLRGLSVAVFVAVLSLGSCAHAQDAVKAAPSSFKLLRENQHVRVVQDTLRPGEKEALHSHPAGWYYVTKPGKMRVTYEDGKSIIWDAKPGEQAWMDAEPPHTSENIGTTTIQYVLVEVKSAARQ